MLALNRISRHDGAKRRSPRPRKVFTASLTPPPSVRSALRVVAGLDAALLLHTFQEVEW